MTMKTFSMFVLLAAAAVNADIYMHSPRGSNNRLNEDTRERTNGDRLFNSQNNDRGGSNVGDTQGESFYEGSVLPLEWTNQHSCGISTEAGQANNDCNVIWQFMCHARVRDGTVTDQIPVNNDDCNGNCDLDGQYGRHESQDYYNLCSMTQRNLGLYTAAQDVLGDPGTGQDAPAGVAGAGAIATRQNPDGNRRGYECDEERDYYPYWRASPWVDIAIFTNTPERCEQYMTQSQNVMGRGMCDVGDPNLLVAKVATVGWIPSNPDDCATMGYTWVQNAVPAHNVAPPACVESMPQRDNHNGNTDGTAAGQVAGFNSVFNWTIPSLAGDNCVVRVRYNISSAENGGAQMDQVADPTYGSYGFAALNSVGPSHDYMMNQLPPNSADTPNAGDATKLDVWTQFALTEGEAAQGERDYVMRNNPQPNIFAEGTVAGEVPRFQLAINTDQFFRTFEDRSHAILLGVSRESTAGLSPLSVGLYEAVPAAAVIYNVNVRGKRGNNQQTYPGLEYDMVPNRLEVMVGDYVHFQWTGSDNNPGNNNGEGNQGEDRSNVVMLRNRLDYPEPGLAENVAASKYPTHGAWGRNLPVEDIAIDPFLGWNKQVLDDMAVLGIDNAHVSIAPMQVKAGAEGTWNYISTRNNNFTNRNHKAQVVVRAVGEATASMGYSGGHVFAGPAYLKVHAGTLAKQHKVTFISGPAANEWESNWVSVEVFAQGNSAHAFHVKEGKENTIDLQMAYTPSPFTTPQLYKTVDGVTTAMKADFNHERGTMLAQVNSGGMHVVKYHVNMPLVAGVGAATLFMLSAVVAGTVASFRKVSKSA